MYSAELLIIPLKPSLHCLRYFHHIFSGWYRYVYYINFSCGARSRDSFPDLPHHSSRPPAPGTPSPASPTPPAGSQVLGPLHLISLALLPAPGPTFTPHNYKCCVKISKYQGSCSDIYVFSKDNKITVFAFQIKDDTNRCTF